MARKSNHISILHFDDRLISRLRVKRSDAGIEILSFDQEQGAWSPQDGTLEAALIAFAARHNIAEDAVFTILPRHDITTRILQLPSHDPEEIASMVRFSAEDYVPYTMEELLLDQCLLHGLPSGESLVLAAFAHRDLVEGHMRLLRAAGVVPEHVYLSTACIASAISAARPEIEQPFAVVNLASSGIEALVFDELGRLAYGRAVAAAHDWTRPPEENAEGIEELAIEVRATLSAFRRESAEGLDVDYVYLCSDFADTRAASAALAPELARTCAAADFARSLSKAADVNLPSVPVMALGAALLSQGRGKVAIDLTPEAVTQDRQIEEVKRRVLKLSAVAALILTGILAAFYQQLQQREAYRAELDRKLATLNSNSGGIIEKREQLQILRQELRPDGSVLEFLANACKVVPKDGLNIAEYHFDRAAGVDIKGRALSLDLIDAFGQALREIGKQTPLTQFSSAKRMYENQNIPERDKRVWEYHYTIPFETAEDKNEVPSTTR